jgi:hypothetical protein
VEERVRQLGVAWLALGVLGGCPARVAPVQTGWSSPLPPRLSPSMSVVDDPSALRRAGAAVDFVRDRVVVLQASTQHSRSRIAVRRVDVDGGVAVIDACVRGSVIQALSAPWVAVAVPSGVHEVRWTCGSDVHATARARR